MATYSPAGASQHRRRTSPEGRDGPVIDVEIERVEKTAEPNRTTGRAPDA
jgi:hypothetical protein